MDNCVFTLTLPVIGEIGFVDWVQVFTVLGIVLVHIPVILLGIGFPFFMIAEWWENKSWKNFIHILFSPMMTFLFLIPMLGLLLSAPFIDSMDFKYGHWFEKIILSVVTIGALLFFYGFVALLVMHAIQ